jgi:hypothetical protein
MIGIDNSLQDRLRPEVTEAQVSTSCDGLDVQGLMPCPAPTLVSTFTQGMKPSRTLITVFKECNRCCSVSSGSSSCVPSQIMPALGSVSDDECDGFEREFSDWSFSSVGTANDNSVRSLKHTSSATYKAGQDAQASAEVPASKQAQLAAALPKLLLSVKVQVSLACALLLSVYLPDIWIAANVHTEADPVLHTVLIIITIMHLTESIALSYAYSSYFLSRYFCLDVVAALAILLDVNRFTDGWWLNTGYAGLVHAVRATKVSACVSH